MGGHGQDQGASSTDVLQRRARELARPAASGRDTALRVLGFVASGQRYLAPLADVVEVVPGSPLARVPHGRPPLLGVATLRSSLLAVFELSEPPAGRTMPPWLIVLGEGPDQLAIAADDVDGIEHLDEEQLLEPDRDELPDAPMTALLRRDGAALLDVGQLLASDRFRIGHDTPAPPTSDLP